MASLGRVIRRYFEPANVAPTVSLAVRMPNLPSPPYEPVEGEEGSKPKKKGKLLPAIPVNVKVGIEYNFITNNIISKVRVEKIWQDEDANTYVVISQATGSGRQTHAIHVSEFKQRVVQGGIQEVSI